MSDMSRWYIHTHTHTTSYISELNLTIFTFLSLVNAKVAFSATVIASHDVFTGPAITRNCPLIFDRVFTNIGNAYNSETGMFYI